MSLEPPPFQESTRCDVCNCSFNTFRRRHHCRCCGRTLCHEHSSNQMALPQFAIYTAVRVCADCFNDSSRAGKDNPQASSNGVTSVTDTFSRLNVDADMDPKTEPVVEHRPSPGVIECKCGMPLCICEAPAPSIDAAPLPIKTPSSSTAPPSTKPKKTDTTTKSRGSTSNSKVSSLFNPGQVTNGSMDKQQANYEVHGEGLREAIKNGDTTAVKKLLSEGVDANYCDKQGMSLLHLAAVFNRTDIAFTLMECGASTDLLFTIRGKRLWIALQLLCNTRCGRRWTRVSSDTNATASASKYYARLLVVDSSGETVSIKYAIHTSRHALLRLPLKSPLPR